MKDVQFGQVHEFWYPMKHQMKTEHDLISKANEFMVNIFNLTVHKSSEFIVFA